MTNKIIDITLTIIIITLAGACNMDRQSLSTEQDSLFKHPAELAKVSLTKPIKITNRNMKDYDISGHNHQNLSFDNSDLTAFFAERGKLTNLSFTNSKLTGVFFSDSQLAKVTFKDSDITDLSFAGATTTEVIFENCTIHNAVFSGLKGHIKFINSTLNAPNFYGSQAVLEFENSVINNQDNPQETVFRSQKLPASITLKDSKLLGHSDEASIIVSGNLTSFKVDGGVLDNVGLGDNIKEVIFNHTELDVGLSGAKLDSININHSSIKRLALGEASINDITINNCQTSDLISLIDTKFQDFTLDSCDLGLLEPWDASGKNFTIRDSKIQKLDMRGLNAKELHFINITTETLDMQKALAENVVQSNVKYQTLNDTGSNIKF